jgi:hypothetical protein
MTAAEQVHATLLTYESPVTPDDERDALAHEVSRRARRLLRDEYGLDGDFPCDQPEVSARRREQCRRSAEVLRGRRRVLAAVGGFMRSADPRGTRRKAGVGA